MFNKLLTVLGILALLAGIAIAGLFFWYESGGMQATLMDKFGQKLNRVWTVATTSTGDPDASQNIIQDNVLQEILGFTAPRVYLFLFLNNTELRPGGGFIGVYAVVKVDKGKPEILRVEGTEILDNHSARDWQSVPPRPLSDYLEIKRWEFRDSNWQPDFALASQKALELYKLEKGLLSDKVDAVIGITPTVLESVLAITGPVEVDGIKFTASNFTETLEYEVEHGFEKKRN